MAQFILGLRLSELFYHEVVKPIIEGAFPRLIYSAALLGDGSDVLGFDTERSTDHNWGPRLMLFLTNEDKTEYSPKIVETLRNDLPHQFRGYPTHFEPSAEEGTNFLKQTTSGRINHKVSVDTVGHFLKSQLGISSHLDMEPIDWLLCSEQRLLGVTVGRVFHDGLGELEAARAALRYYPDDIWLYLLAAQWKRIAQQEAFVGRCGEVGDELGSALVAANLVRDLMRLGFLMERTYAPYSKWFGTAFTHLACANQLLPDLEGTVNAKTWQNRESHLIGAYSTVARVHNELKITEPLSPEPRPFFNRPFLVIDAERFSSAIRGRISNNHVSSLPMDLGSIDQLSDSTDLLTNSELRRRLQSLYAADT